MDVTEEGAIGDRERGLLREHAARIREGEVLGRSRALNDLFDFLVRCSLADRSPKEIEVRHEVFSKGIDVDVAQDASVRVYIHRLRRKLDDYYTARGGEGARLYIPRGEYRLRVSGLPDLVAPVPESEDTAPAEPVTPPALPPGSPPPRRWKLPAAILLALLLLNALAWAVFVRGAGSSDPLSTARASAFWRPVTAGGRPLVIVVGDYYIFGESDSRVEISRLVREFAINSRGDLDTFVASHPDQMGRYVDLDLSYLPVGAASAIGELLPIVKGRALDQPVRVMPLSRMTPEILSSSNIVYIGLLSGLGPLRDPLFAASRLRVGADYDELIDKRTGRHFVADWANHVGGLPSSRDYGYVASTAGPNGNHIVVIAGTRDPGLIQAARSVTDAAVLGGLDRFAQDGHGVEALFSVESMGNTSLGGKLLLAGRLDPSAAWQNVAGREVPVPDQPPAPPSR